MNITPISFQMGSVRKIDFSSNTIFVLPESGGMLIPMNLTNIPAFQIMPEIGQRLIFLRYGEFWSMPVKFLGDNDSKLRQGSFPLAEGEIQIQGRGGSYLFLDDLGDISLVDGSMLGSIKILNQNREIQLEHITTIIKTFDDLSIIIDQTDDSITIDNPVQQQSLTMNKDGIAIENSKFQSKITLNQDGIALKAVNIFLDGNIFMGNGASDPNTRVNFGNVVTSGPTGTFPLDFVTNIPIPGSIDVKAG